MFRATNARGLNSLTNGISLTSDLPPLNPSIGSIYQSPNSTGTRNVLIETQRMRTTIMGQIQAVQSDQDRQMQQSETQMNMILRELSPKIQNLDRHNSFNQQQLDDLVERLSQLDSTTIPSIQQKSDEVQLKFEQSIKAETQSKFLPISDDIKHEQSKSEQLSDSTTSSVSNTNDKLEKLSLLYENFEKQFSETHSYVKNHIININPRISTIETRLSKYETAAESSIQNQTNKLDFQRSTKKIRKDIEDLEIDGIPIAIQNASSEILNSITSISSQIEQKFASSKLSLANIDDTVNITSEQQKNVDSQIESLANSSLSIETSMEQEEQEFNQRLTDLENSIKSINDEISGKIKELQENNSGNSKWILDALNDDIQSLRTNASQYLNQLNQDWSKFSKDNEEAQKFTDSEINNISSVLNDEFGLLKKIAAAEKRSNWCLNRLKAWQKEVEEAERLNVSDEKLIQKLQILEEKLKDAESRLNKIDNSKAPKDKKFKKEKFVKPDEEPSSALDGNEIEPFSLPSELKLTYDDQDADIVIPDLPSLEERKKNAKNQDELIQPKVNPDDNDKDDDNNKEKKDNENEEKDNNKEKKDNENEEKDNNKEKKDNENEGNEPNLIEEEEEVSD